MCINKSITINFFFYTYNNSTVLTLKLIDFIKIMIFYLKRFFYLTKTVITDIASFIYQVLQIIKKCMNVVNYLYNNEN